jgi:hypothetical protein
MTATNIKKGKVKFVERKILALADILGDSHCSDRGSIVASGGEST